MENTTTPSLAGLKAGLVLGLLLCLSSVSIAMLGMVGNQTISTLASVVIWIGVLYWGMTEFKKANGGLMTLGQGVGLGVIAVTVGAIISTIFIYIYSMYLDPSYFQQILDVSRDKMMESGMEDEMIENALAQTKDFFWVGLIFAVIASVVIGTIVSLIMSAILQKKELDHTERVNEMGGE